jgi:hypothetical protein
VSTFSAQRDKVLKLAGDAAGLVRERGNADAASELEVAADDLRAGRLSVAVVGEFKRGKSSLLSALIEEPGLFPDNTSVATNMVATASYGERERIVVYVDDPDEPGERLSEEISRDRIADFVTEQGNPGNKRRARLLTIELPSEKLRDGLMFVDTPGVGGLNTEHTAVTYGFVTNADVVLFVIDALSTMSTEELGFVETVGEHSQAVIFVVTKIDKKPDYQAIVDNTRQKVAATLSRPAEEITVVPVSSLAKLEYLESGDEEDLEVSNFQALEGAVWGVLRERGAAIMLLRALGTIVRTLDGAIAPIKAELEAYTEKTEEELDAAERELATAAKRGEDLQKGQSGWRKTLKRELQKTSLEMGDAFRSGSRALRRRRDELLHDQRLMESPVTITSLIERDVALFGQRLADDLKRRGQEISEKLADETALELNPAAPDVPIAAEAATPTLDDVHSGDKGRSIFRGAQGISMGSSSGGMVGGLLGTIVAGASTGSIVPGPGTLIGGAIGALVGMGLGLRSNLRDIAESDRRKRRDAVAKQVNPWLDECIGQIDSSMKQAQAMTEHAISDAFDDMLKAEVERVRESQAALAKARKRTKEEAAARATELREPLTRLERARREADAQAQAALYGGDAPSPEPVPAAAGRDEGDWAEA